MTNSGASSHGSRPPIRVLDVAGSPEAIGYAHGQTFAEEIRHYTAERVALVASGLWSGGALAKSDVIDIAESMIQPHAEFDPALHAEMVAMAEAAGISVAEAIVVGGFTDFVDTVRAVVGGPLPSTLAEDDCTAVIVPDSRSRGAGFLAQTWDMHASATDHVVLLRIRPDEGPGANVFTTTGCLGQIGMNTAGVAVGINNLNGLDGTRGVTWTSVVRGMLKTESAREALDLLLATDLAGAHNYLIFDREGNGFNVEAMPSSRPVTTLGPQPLVHTNHVLDLVAKQAEAKKDTALLASSGARLSRATELLGEGHINYGRLRDLTRDPEAICQVATAPFHVESSGAAIMRPKTLDFWACWGRPADNTFRRVALPSAETDHDALRRVARLPILSIGERSGIPFYSIRPEWADDLEAIELGAFPTALPEDLYSSADYIELARLFPQGCFVGLDGHRPIAIGTGVRVDFALEDPQHTFHDLAERAGNASGHVPTGDWYYGTDIAVTKPFRRRGIGQELYELRKQVCRDLNLRGIIAGGVIPGYSKHRNELDADTYIAKVATGELYDPTLTFQIENGFEARCALAGYIRDPEVNDYAALIVWHNPAYNASRGVEVGAEQIVPDEQKASATS